MENHFLVPLFLIFLNLLVSSKPNEKSKQRCSILETQ
jgi:hypothetical protein